MVLTLSTAIEVHFQCLQIVESCYNCTVYQIYLKFLIKKVLMTWEGLPVAHVITSGD